ncbi:hypothetical protein ACNKHU_23340 [Shigella flexneri]
MLYLGGGVINAPARVSELAENGFANYHDLNGAGYLPESASTIMGMLGMQACAALTTILQEADLLIVLGARFDDRAIGGNRAVLSECQNSSCRYRPVQSWVKLKTAARGDSGGVDDVLAQLIPLVENATACRVAPVGSGFAA